MKRIFNWLGIVSFALLLGFTAVSCNKDDNGPEKEYSLIGKWQTIKYYYEEYLNGELLETGEDVLPEDEKLIYEFQEGGKGKIYIPELQGGSLPMTWERDGKYLEISIMGEGMGSLEIVKLNDTDLELMFTEEYSEGGYSYKYSETAVMKKIQ